MARRTQNFRYTWDTPQENAARQNAAHDVVAYEQLVEQAQRWREHASWLRGLKIRWFGDKP
jgi:hypothetical protein